MMGSNPGYLFKSFLFNTLIQFSEFLLLIIGHVILTHLKFSVKAALLVPLVLSLMVEFLVVQASYQALFQLQFKVNKSSENFHFNIK